MGWLRRLRSTIAGARASDEFDEETRFHIDELTDVYTQQGLTPDEARRRARQRFGNLPSMRDRTRDADTFRWLTDASQDLRFAARTLAQESRLYRRRGRDARARHRREHGDLHDVRRDSPPLATHPRAVTPGALQRRCRRGDVGGRSADPPLGALLARRLSAPAATAAAVRIARCRTQRRSGGARPCRQRWRRDAASRAGAPRLRKLLRHDGRERRRWSHAARRGRPAGSGTGGGHQRRLLASPAECRPLRHRSRRSAEQDRVHDRWRDAAGVFRRARAASARPLGAPVLPAGDRSQAVRAESHRHVLAQPDRTAGAGRVARAGASVCDGSAATVRQVEASRGRRAGSRTADPLHACGTLERRRRHLDRQVSLFATLAHPPRRGRRWSC